jgi:hypothetical protein
MNAVTATAGLQLDHERPNATRTDGRGGGAGTFTGTRPTELDVEIDEVRSGTAYSGPRG